MWRIAHFYNKCNILKSAPGKQMIFSCSVYVMPELQFSYIYNAGKIRLSILLAKLFDQFKFKLPVQKFLESDFNIIFL